MPLMKFWIIKYLCLNSFRIHCPFLENICERVIILLPRNPALKCVWNKLFPGQ